MKETKKEKITLKKIKSTANKIKILRNENDKDFSVIRDAILKFSSAKKESVL